jgi:hypothetical protein
MPLLKLRQAMMEEIHRNLERGFLTRQSFEAKFNGEDGVLVHLIYRDAPEYEFKALQPESRSNSAGNWKTSECPGRHFTTAEQFSHSDSNNAIHAAYSWADRIVADMLANMKAGRASGQFESKFRQAIEIHADNLDKPGEPFTAKEADEWIAKFEEMSERLEALEAANGAQHARFEQMTRELDALRKQASDVPKRAWLKKVGNKFMDFVEGVLKEGGKELASGTAKILLERMTDGGGG